MAYSTEMGIRRDLPEATSDLVTSSDIRAAIIIADSLIDSALGQRYTTPFSPIPTQIEYLSALKTVYLILIRYPDKNSEEDLRRLERTYDELMKAYSNGVLPITGGTELADDSRGYVYVVQPTVDPEYSRTREATYE